MRKERQVHDLDKKKGEKGDHSSIVIFGIRRRRREGQNLLPCLIWQC